jgi:phosphoenolpyruvate carboxykinase (ATP)
VAYRSDPVFGFDVPVEFEGIPARILDPASTWANRESYDRKYRALAARFIENFKLIKEGCPENVAHAGPGAISPRS